MNKAQIDAIDALDKIRVDVSALQKLAELIRERDKGTADLIEAVATSAAAHAAETEEIIRGIVTDQEGGKA